MRFLVTLLSLLLGLATLGAGALALVMVRSHQDDLDSATHNGALALDQAASTLESVAASLDRLVALIAPLRQSVAEARSSLDDGQTVLDATHRAGSQLESAMGSMAVDLRALEDGLRRFVGPQEHLTQTATLLEGVSTQLDGSLPSVAQLGDDLERLSASLQPVGDELDGVQADLAPTPGLLRGLADHLDGPRRALARPGVARAAALSAYGPVGLLGMLGLAFLFIAYATGSRRS